MSICDKSFFLNNDLNCNIADIHGGKSLTNVIFVTKAFFLKNDLNPNIATAHKGKKPFKCHFCDKSFFSEGQSKSKFCVYS